MSLKPGNPEAAPPKTLAEIGSMGLEENRPTRLLPLGGNLLACIDDEIEYGADLIDVSTGTAKHLPRYDGYGVIDIFADESDKTALYLVVMKGQERPFQRLIKIDANTREALWTCPLSKTIGRWRWTQDSGYFFYNDTKNLFSVSKKTGKSSDKIPLPHQGDLFDKQISIPDAARLFALHEGDIILCCWKSRTLTQMLVRIDPQGGAVKWELELGKLEYAQAAALKEGIVHLLCSSGICYKIDAATGRLIVRETLGDGYALGWGFFETETASGTELKALVSPDKYEHHFRIVTCPARDGKISVEDASFIPDFDQVAGIVKGNLLYWAQMEVVFDLAKKERLSLLDVKDPIRDMQLLGNRLYLILDEDSGGRLLQLGEGR